MLTNEAQKYFIKQQEKQFLFTATAIAAACVAIDTLIAYNVLTRATR